MKWLMALPRRILVIVLIGGFILFYVFSEPPRTICDAQLEAFQERTKFFLKIEEKKAKFKKKTPYQEKREECGQGRTSGACYDLFQGMKVVMREAKSVSRECFGDLAYESAFRASLWETLELMVKLAWGDEPPISPSQRFGIFDKSDYAFFCEMKNVANLVYSDNKWSEFVSEQLNTAKGSEKLSKEERWARSIMSAPCN
jgi:hypothetical protein